MKYLNITKENEYVLTEDIKYTSKELMEEFSRAIISQPDIKITEFYRAQRSKYVLNIVRHSISESYQLLLKNITGAGWVDKPKIKRVQVANINDVLNSQSDSICIILGYYNFDNNPIFVAWDAYRYDHHNTIRSCYVTVDSLKRGYEKGYYVGVDSAQKLWIFLPQYIDRFLSEYTNYISEIRGSRV